MVFGSLFCQGLPSASSATYGQTDSTVERIRRQEASADEFVDHQRQVVPVWFEQLLERLVELARGQVVGNRQVVEGIADDQVVAAQRCARAAD